MPEKKEDTFYIDICKVFQKRATISPKRVRELQTGAATSAQAVAQRAVRYKRFLWSFVTLTTTANTGVSFPTAKARMRSVAQALYKTNYIYT